MAASVHQWGTEEVGAWLDFLCLTEYKDIFTRHDVRGAELIQLERRDLKVAALTGCGCLWLFHSKSLYFGVGTGSLGVVVAPSGGVDLRCASFRTWA